MSLIINWTTILPPTPGGEVASIDVSLLYVTLVHVFPFVLKQ